MLKTNQNLLQKEVTRKEFIIYMTAGLLSLLGVGNFLELVLGRKLPSPQGASLNGVNENSQAQFGTRKFGK